MTVNRQHYTTRSLPATTQRGSSSPRRRLESRGRSRSMQRHPHCHMSVTVRNPNARDLKNQAVSVTAWGRPRMRRIREAWSVWGCFLSNSLFNFWIIRQTNKPIHKHSQYVFALRDFNTRENSSKIFQQRVDLDCTVSWRSGLLPPQRPPLLRLAAPLLVPEDGGDGCWSSTSPTVPAASMTSSYWTWLQTPPRPTSCTRWV